MFITSAILLSTTQLIANIISVLYILLELETFTGNIFTLFGVDSAIVPAICVPCPTLSSKSPSLAKTSYVPLIFPENFSSNKSKLSIKLNVAYCNSAIKKIESNRKKPALEFRDEPLLNSDVFDYVGYDNQFVSEPAKAPARAIELSRRMEKVEKKKFPNIELEKDGYTLFVYGPQDRNILSAGFRSGCCFRPRGNADNSGKDNSLLNYCLLFL